MIVNNLDDFFQLIDDAEYGEYKVLFSNASYHSGDWPASRYIEHLLNLRVHSEETKISFKCESIESEEHLSLVKIWEIYPATLSGPEKEKWTLWKIAHRNG